MFKHALTHDVAYSTLLLERRKALHRIVAAAIEELYADRLLEQYETLAHHYYEGQEWEQALDYLLKAGRKAVAAYANQDAIGYLTRGLDLLKTLPDGPERAQQELDLQIALGPILVATKGFAAPEVESVYTRARELSQQVGETPQIVTVLWGLWSFYATRAEHLIARELAEQLLRLAQREDDPALLLPANFALGFSLWCHGELVPACAHLEQGIALYDPGQHGSLAFLYGEDPGASCLGHGAWVLWLIGYPDRALERSDEALTLAQELSHPFSMAWALCAAAMLHQKRGEAQAARQRAEAAIALCTDQEFPMYLALGTVARGWALAEQGEMGEGIKQIRQGLAAL